MTEVLAARPEDCYFGAGKVYFDRYDANGVRTGFFELGDVSELGTRPTDDVKKHFGSRTRARSLYAKALAGREVEIDITFWEWKRKNLALSMMGQETYYTQSTATVTGEQLSAALKLGAVYKTANRQISSVVIKQGATTLVAGTDYQVLDANIGLIEILEGGAATPDAAVTADYSAAAIATTAQPTLAPFTEGEVLGGLMFVGDPVHGPAIEAHWWKVSVSPKDVASFINDDFAPCGLTVSVLDDTAGAYGGSDDYPLGRIYYPVNA